MGKQHAVYWSLIWFTLMFFSMNPLSVAADNVVVIPIGGAAGNAIPSDVLKGKTFSCSAGKGLVGTLELNGECIGDAEASDVLAGKTFSNTLATGLTGTLELPPCAQSFKNSNNMTFNLIPAGTFFMGSPETEAGRVSLIDGPEFETQHQVTITRSFYIQVTEVTQEQWWGLIGNNPSEGNTGSDYPLNNITWFSAAQFANLLSQQEGLSECYVLTGCSSTPGDNMMCDNVSINQSCTGYRLPTEAEWEYAARAGTSTAYANPYSFDNFDNSITGFNKNYHAMGWYEFNNTLVDSVEDGSDLGAAYPSGSKPVAQKQANRWGIYDMHGNVSEWCQDWFQQYNPLPLPVTDPTGPVTGSYRNIRGGTYNSHAGHGRSAVRNYMSPTSRHLTRGFRLVKIFD